MEKQRLIEENMNLKKALAICMNGELVKNLAGAIERIDSGEFVSEDEFFKDSVQVV